MSNEVDKLKLKISKLKSEIESHLQKGQNISPVDLSEFRNTQEDK